MTSWSGRLVMTRRSHSGVRSNSDPMNPQIKTAKDVLRSLELASEELYGGVPSLVTE